MLRNPELKDFADRPYPENVYRVGTTTLIRNEDLTIRTATLEFECYPGGLNGPKKDNPTPLRLIDLPATPTYDDYQEAILKQLPDTVVDGLALKDFDIIPE